MSNRVLSTDIQQPPFKYLPLSGAAPPLPSSFSVLSTPTDSWTSRGTFVFTPKKSHCTPVVAQQSQYGLNSFTLYQASSCYYEHKASSEVTSW